MSRSGYSDDADYVDLYRASVDRALRGKRGRAFLRELAIALDAMPVRELVAHQIVTDGHACALGAVALARGADVSRLDPEDAAAVAVVFGIATSMAREIVYENDEGGPLTGAETPAARWTRMRAWVDARLAEAAVLEPSPRPETTWRRVERP
jgi:hypothetical protein